MKSQHQRAELIDGKCLQLAFLLNKSLLTKTWSDCPPQRLCRKDPRLQITSCPTTKHCFAPISISWCRRILSWNTGTWRQCCWISEQFGTTNWVVHSDWTTINIVHSFCLISCVVYLLITVHSVPFVVHLSFFCHSILRTLSSFPWKFPISYIKNDTVSDMKDKLQ